MHAPSAHKKSKKPKSRSSRSGSSASQSTSVKSPPPQQTSFPDIAEHAAPEEAEEDFSPRPDLRNSLSAAGFPSTGFPSTGFKDARSRKNSDAGVFLARRGD